MTIPVVTSRPGNENAGRFRVLNTETVAVPPFAVMEVFEYDSARQAVKIRKPTVDNSTAVLLNGQAAIEAGSFGLASLTLGGIALVGQDGNDYLPGDVVGVIAGEWYLTRSRCGFTVRIMGIAATSFVQISESTYNGIIAPTSVDEDGLATAATEKIYRPESLDWTDGTAVKLLHAGSQPLIENRYYGAKLCGAIDGQRVFVTTESAVCKIPLGIRIDSGNADDGYEWTSIVPNSEGVFGEEAGINSVALDILAFNPDGEEVTAGPKVFSATYDSCLETVFFLADDTTPARVVVEYLEDEPSSGEFYQARLQTELVSLASTVSWTPGDIVWAKPINPKRPTLEILMFADQTRDGEIDEETGRPFMLTDRCCDEDIVDESSAGEPCLCEDLEVTELTFSYGGVTTTYTDPVGIFSVGGVDFNIAMSINCVDGDDGQRSVTSNVTLWFRNEDGTNGIQHFSADGNSRDCNDPLVWTDGDFAIFNCSLAVS